MNRLRIYVDISVPPEALELLREGTAGHELVFPQKAVLSVLAPERDSQFASVDVAFGQPDPEAVEGTTRLKWIQVSSSGITRYDTPPFRALLAQRGIALTNSAGVYHEACADHVLSFMLAQARQLPAALKARAADGPVARHALRGSSVPLRGQTLLILGFGSIGRRLAELLRPYEMNLTAYRRQPQGDEGVPVVSSDRLGDALREADHVVDLLPDSPETRHFFDRARFSEIKPGAVFYNIGRGTTVVQEALLAALRSGRLTAAWLDVTEPEPLPDDHPLRAEPHCHITPHIAGGHRGEEKMLVRHFLRNFGHFIRGEALVDRVI